jgi:hypothetical protein
VTERYVRPPIVGLEARSERAAVWRFRLLLLLALVAVAAIAIAIVALAVPSGEQNPGVGAGVPLRPHAPSELA